MITLTRLAITLSITAGFSAAQIVNLGYATYQGTFNATTGNTAFLGIRYAAPPSGNLRWVAPQTPQAVAGIIQADAQPPGCPQAGTGVAATDPFRQNVQTRAAAEDPEDCLFLNVVTPQMPGADVKSKPVVVWIHGGGYVAGDAAMFDGNDLVSEANGGVVAVIIQYRLGVFGFLAGNEVKAGGSLNAGLLLTSSQIAKFGGDPSQVTIWGESAGAGSVLQHVVARGGKTSPPLFRGAITSSTFLPSQYLYNDVIPQTLYNEVVSQTGCTDAADTLACLRAVEFASLETANVNLCLSAFFGTFTFVPVVDGTFITQRPTQALLQRQTNGKALLSVTNADEGLIFVNTSTASTVQTPDYVAQLFPDLGSQEVASAAAVYAHLGAPIDQAIAIMGDSIFVCPTYFLLRAFDGVSFKGEFAVPPGTHGSDVQYYFPTQPPAFANPAFDAAFSHSFLDFAMSLDPNVKPVPTITPSWKVWADGSVEMLFNETESGEPVVQPITTSNSLLERCGFWESVSAQTNQ
ncbi:hypothetical protein H0H92_002693 [Tricholoma furcatifolium]|nr:hypothetical protein H0H92_002693 [Tricholoma furcatifolium]